MKQYNKLPSTKTCLNYFHLWTFLCDVKPSLQGFLSMTAHCQKHFSIWCFCSFFSSNEDIRIMDVVNWSCLFSMFQCSQSKLYCNRFMKMILPSYTNVHIVKSKVIKVIDHICLLDFIVSYSFYLSVHIFSDFCLKTNFVMYSCYQNEEFNPIDTSCVVCNLEEIMRPICKGIPDNQLVTLCNIN